MIVMPIRCMWTCLIVAMSVGLIQAEEPVRKIAVTAAIANEFPVTNVDYSLSVKFVKPSLAEAKKDVDQAVTKLRKSLSGLPEEMLVIQIPSLDQGREYKYEDRDKKFIGFFVERSVTMELKDYALVDRLETILAENEDFSLSSRSFTHKDLIQLRHDARKSALEAAKRKARSMAEVLGMTIGLPLEISEGNSRVGTTLNVPFAQGGFTEATRAKVNTVTISAEVDVVFEMRPVAEK